MKNIQFINRIKELEELKHISKENFFLIVRGRRRIGKTTLLLKAYPNSAYIFVWPDKSLNWIVENICNDLSLPSFKYFSDIVNYILDKNQIIIFDEFQNFLNVDKSIFGELQKIIDIRKIQNKPFKIAVSGSSYSMIKKVFNNPAAPLYGRRTNELVLDHLPIQDIFNWLKMSLNDFIKYWAVFEGVPYYYELINQKKYSEEVLINLFFSKNSKLNDEGKAVLSLEFGQDSKTYNTILSAISQGKTKLNELSVYFQKNEVIKYLDMLRKEYNLIVRKTPILDDIEKSRNSIYEIEDNFLSFWFYFYEKQKPFIEQKREQEAINFFHNNFNSFVAKKFEKFILILIKEKILLKKYEFDKIGKQWGKYNDKVYEIDLIGINEKKKEINFIECKWQDNVNADDVLKELKEKSKFVDWNKENRKESFVIFAKSFKNKKENCFDLKDIEAILK